MTLTLTEEILGGLRKIVALHLWQLGAIKLNVKEPFRLTSGNYSPLYVNCRQLISSPGFVDFFTAGVRSLCESAELRFDLFAGGETAGIPFAAFLAQRFGRPMVYVRKATKDYGLASRIEGLMLPGYRVLLVEDLITDAGSKLNFISAIRESGGIVEDVLVVFDRLQGGAEALASQGIKLHALTDLNMVLSVAEEANLLISDDLEKVRAYLHDPRLWHEQRGLPFKERPGP